MTDGNDDPFPQVYLHGTRADLKAGDLITVGYTSNFDDRALSWVYFTAAMHAAKWGSALARGEEAERIYAVVPTGAIEDDPNVTDKKFPANPTRSFRSREPLRVVGELTGWEPFGAQQVREMKEGLAELKRQGKDMIID